MALPQGVMDFMNKSARRAGVTRLAKDADLFRIGVLDSFALVDFVNVLEEECGIRVPDADVDPQNFQTIEAIERYVEGRKA